MILLDTCVLLWLPLGAKKLPRAVVDAIRRTPRGQRWVCPLSAYEIGTKVARGKLSLPLPIAEWLETTYRGRGLTPLPITGEVCLRASQLPDIHRDPVDRILVAQALEHGLILLTCDANIHRYPGVQAVWT
ncbi:MAG: type II toxin-antitoxin system VapC family toxin [Deltaproteobacteria bacterium]|nr:type II toxin-antitoxin system VapC family toxin [Deltaproteobacteria bacterium]